MHQITLKRLIDSDASREQIQDWCRQQSRAVSTGTAVLSRVLGKYLMYTSARDCAITPHLAMDGIWEPWVTLAIARHLQPGMKCLDVGACYGYYSLLMADLVGGKNGYVEAWEPIWSPILRMNAELNGFPIQVMSYAMGKPGYGHRPQIPDGMFNAGGLRLQRTELTCPPSAIKHIEYAEPKGTLFDFIKIDVEGAEADVWETLNLAAYPKDHRMVVCMEFTPSSHADPHKFLRRIEEDGFRLGTVGHDGTTRPVSINEAATPDTGDFRMLWLESP